MTDADRCKANGWRAGTILEGRESYGGQRWAESRIRLTAIGEADVLACEVERRSSEKPEWYPVNGMEGPWTLDCRDWRPVAAEGQKSAVADTPNSDPIRPAHYTGLPIEPIAAIEAWGLNFATGSAVKYIARAGRKGDAVIDLRKAVCLLNREIERLEANTR